MLTLIKEYDYRGIPLHVVRRLTKQILVALDYLHSKLHIIHTDLKPENVMLTQPIRPRKWLEPLQPSNTDASAGKHTSWFDCLLSNPPFLNSAMRSLC